MWIYEQDTGEFFHEVAGDEQPVGVGYSGTGVGRNNPKAQAIHDVGPIPLGRYRIGMVYSHPALGPLTMNLTPCGGQDMFDRDAFRMHGNNAKNDASHGCIILDRPIRLMVSQSDDRDLLVRRSEPCKVAS